MTDEPTEGIAAGTEQDPPGGGKMPHKEVPAEESLVQDQDPPEEPGKWMPHTTPTGDEES